MVIAIFVFGNVVKQWFWQHSFRKYCTTNCYSNNMFDNVVQPNGSSNNMFDNVVKSLGLATFVLELL